MFKQVCEIAIFMPTYNAEFYVGEALESILSQTEEDFIIVISDDCSTDRTVDVIRSYMKKDSNRIILLQNEVNLGPTKNFNMILDYIESNIVCKYISFFAGDDLMLPERLATHKKILNEQENSIMLFCPVLIKNHEGASALNSNIVGEINRDSGAFKYNMVIKKNFPFVTNGAFIKSEAIKNNRYSLGSLSDFVFFIRIAMQSKQNIYYHAEPLTIYRRHAEGITSSYSLINLIFQYMKYYMYLLRYYPKYSPWILTNLGYAFGKKVTKLFRVKK